MSDGNVVTAAEQQATARERQGIVAWAGQQYGVEVGKVMAVLRSTCFSTGKGEDEATDAEVAGLLIVSRAYNLNPFLREIFAFRDRKGGIVPVVGVDGWSRIINDKKELDGIEFRYSEQSAAEWIECVIYRKDRSHPTVVRELLSECKRDTIPWKTHTSRMLRHKALIQCARVAFGFAGIFDEDEAARIVEVDVTPAPAITERSASAALKAAVTKGAAEKGADQPATITTSEGAKPDQSAVAVASASFSKSAGTPEKRDEIVGKLRAAKDLDALGDEADKANILEWTVPDLSTINAAYHEMVAKLT